MEPARAGLQKIMAEALRRAPENDAPVLAWPVVCGAAVAARTRAVAFSAGTLSVEAPDAAWRGQLIELAAQYLSAYRKLFGERVQRIRFVLPGEVAGVNAK
jgi:hypothetical protein